MEPFVLQNPKGFCKMNSSHCPPRAVPGQWLGCVPGWEGRAPCSPTASPVPPSVASTHSCPAYFGNGNEVHGPTLNWLGRTGIAWPMPRHQLPHCPRHSFSKQTPPGDSQKSPTSKKRISTWHLLRKGSLKGLPPGVVLHRDMQNSLRDMCNTDLFAKGKVSTGWENPWGFPEQDALCYSRIGLGCRMLISN